MWKGLLFAAFVKIEYIWISNSHLMTKEQEILAVAEEEFFRNGYLSTSMVTVARRAGVTHAMVNYYFRSKEQLFLKILDTHTYSFIENLRPIMREDGDFVDTLVAAADVVFDTLNADRMFPFLIQDIAKSAPELLERYRQPVERFASEMLSRHSARLSKHIASGTVARTGMKEMLENMLLLVVSPFLMIPTLENVCHLDATEIDGYLSRRKAEMELVLRSRYSAR